jgi:hypothetical protein
VSLQFTLPFHNHANLLSYRANHGAIILVPPVLESASAGAAVASCGDSRELHTYESYSHRPPKLKGEL